MDARFSARDIVDAIILRHENASRYGRLTTMKLQKLLCAAHGLSLASGAALVDGQFQAWDDGPVFYEVFSLFKGRKYLSINDVSSTDDSVLDGVESDAIDEAIGLYGDFSGDALSDISHAAQPWSDAWATGKNTPIGNDSLALHYQGVRDSQVSDSEADKLVEKLLGSL